VDHRENKGRTNAPVDGVEQTLFERGVFQTVAADIQHLLLRHEAFKGRSQAPRRPGPRCVLARAPHRGRVLPAFCVLAPRQREAIENLWGVHGDAWRLFRRICRFFGV